PAVSSFSSHKVVIPSVYVGLSPNTTLLVFYQQRTLSLIAGKGNACMAISSGLCIAIVLLSLVCLPLIESAQYFHGGNREAGDIERRADDVPQESNRASLLRQTIDREDEKAGDEHGTKLVCKDDDDKGLQELCPVACFRPDPVCGEDGVTYWCGCRDARCAGIAVSHVGFCKIHSSAPAEKGSQALLLVHALWLALLGFSCLFGLL
ncbi:hypothetical protein GOP47_0022221, partial [Adiantum capillus-veneris]